MGCALSQDSSELGSLASFVSKGVRMNYRVRNPLSVSSFGFRGWRHMPQRRCCKQLDLSILDLPRIFHWSISKQLRYFGVPTLTSYSPLQENFQLRFLLRRLDPHVRQWLTSLGLSLYSAGLLDLMSMYYVCTMTETVGLWRFEIFILPSEWLPRVRSKWCVWWSPNIYLYIKSRWYPRRKRHSIHCKASDPKL